MLATILLAALPLLSCEYCWMFVTNRSSKSKGHIADSRTLLSSFHQPAVLAIDGCTRNATVKAGDTCDAICEQTARCDWNTPDLSIAHRYGVSTFQLALVNENAISENCDNLTPDQTLCLGVTGHDCTKVYTIQENEWVWESSPSGD
jgi:hypothetical protein